MAEVKVSITKKNGTFYEITKLNGLKNVSNTSQTNANAEKIFYGLIPSTGSCDLTDIDSNLLENIKNDLITDSNLNLSIYVNGVKKQEGITSETSYDSTSLQVSFTYSDKIEKLKQIKIPGWKETGLVYSTHSSSLYTVVYRCLSAAGLSSAQIATSLSGNITISAYGNIPQHTITISDYLRRCKIYNAGLYYKEGSAYDILNKICQATQLILYQDSAGGLKFVSGRPIALSGTQCIVIPRHKQYTEPKNSVILKNKYNNVEYNRRELNISEKETFRSSYEIKDSNNNFSAEKLPGGTILQGSGDTRYFCFFITVSSSDEVISSSIYRTPQEQYTKQLPGLVQLFGTNINPDAAYSTAGNIGSVFSNNDTSITMDNYDFTAMSDTITRLSYYNKLNRDVFAIKKSFLTTMDSGYKYMVVALLERCISPTTEKKLFNAGDTPFSFNYENEFISSSLLYRYDENNEVEMYNIVFNHIANDYSEGINTAKVTISCSDYYDTNGTLVKNWSNGDIIDIGDIVRVDKEAGSSFYKDSNNNNVYWRVTGRTFRYSGCPYIDLELQEVKFI